MAKKKQADLFDHLRARGVRKKVAKSLSKSASSRNGKRAEALAQTALADLRSASDAIRNLVRRDSTRSEASKKAARTRKRNAAKRSASAKKGGATRKKARAR
jgi:hypothetical protein